MAQDTVVATAITASGTTWSQLKTGSERIVLDKIATNNAAKADPTTQCTISETGGGTTGGLLEAGTCYVTYSFVDPYGETLAGGRSAQLTVVTAHKPRVTLPSLPTGVQSINLYVTPVGGAAGTEVLYATGITTTTFDMLYARLADAGNPPAANTTGADGHHALLYSLLDNNGSVFQRQFSELVSNYLRGDPVDRGEFLRRLARLEGVARSWLTMIAETRTLAVANPGTLAWASGGGLNGKTVRTFS